METLEKYLIPVSFIIFGIICLINPKMGFDMNDTNPHNRIYIKTIHSKQTRILGIVAIILGLIMILLVSEIVVITL